MDNLIIKVFHKRIMGFLFSLMVHIMKVISKMVNLKAKANLLISKTPTHTMDFGKKVCLMAMANKLLMAIPMMEILLMEKKME
jgi:hypothetical protein